MLSVEGKLQCQWPSPSDLELLWKTLVRFLTKKGTVVVAVPLKARMSPTHDVNGYLRMGWSKQSSLTGPA